jgi:hypothetical protein
MVTVLPRNCEMTSSESEGEGRGRDPTQATCEKRRGTTGHTTQGSSEEKKQGNRAVERGNRAVRTGKQGGENRVRAGKQGGESGETGR